MSDASDETTRNARSIGKLRPFDEDIYARLAHIALSRPECSASMSYIGRAFGASDKVVERSIRHLEEAGLVLKVHRPGKANLYILPFLDAPTDDAEGWF